VNHGTRWKGTAACVVYLREMSQLDLNQCAGCAAGRRVAELERGVRDASRSLWVDTAPTERAVCPSSASQASATWSRARLRWSRAVSGAVENGADEFPGLVDARELLGHAQLCGMSSRTANFHRDGATGATRFPSLRKDGIAANAAGGGVSVSPGLGDSVGPPVEGGTWCGRFAARGNGCPRPRE
jgi:hypothetical protein